MEGEEGERQPRGKHEGDSYRWSPSALDGLEIEDALKEADNVKGRAAELLQISYKMFLAKLKEHRLE